MDPAGTLATGTITVPASPVDGMTITFSTTKTITALTVNANTGQSIVSAPTVLPANQAGAYVYRLSNTTWYPIETVPTNVPVAPAGGSLITSGTAVASTSGTSITFSSIPSWVKRITIVFTDVSTTGSSPMTVRIGSGSVTSSGYRSYRNGFNTAGGVACGYNTTGFQTESGSSASYSRVGSMTLQTANSNIWSALGFLNMDNTSGSYIQGQITLGGVLDRIVLTTVGGTDTFDAGSVNVAYEIRKTKCL
jgi:hypothetical protein